MQILGWTGSEASWTMGGISTRFANIPLGIKPLDHLADVC